MKEKMIQVDRKISDTLKTPLANSVAWLIDVALPFWFAKGIDWDGGGFYERFEQDGRLIADAPRRTRVVARQIFAFMAAGRMGWTGDWRRAVDHGAATLFDRCIQPDGLVISTSRPDGTPLDTRYDFYDHAFALFALGQLAAVPDHNARALAAAETMMDAMERRFRHADAGFLEDEKGTLSLRANPHMHLLEACLTLERAPGASPRWRRLADEIVSLAARRFIDPDHGGLREFFDSNWSPMPDDSGRLIEPGHQFEWSWLLHQWNAGPKDAAIASRADRLCDIGEAYGLGVDGATAIDELWDDFRVRSATARNWPTTERIKACVERARRGDNADLWEARAAASLDALSRFTQTATPGLWHDRLMPDLTPIPGPCAASSLYHIVCAIETAQAYVAPGDAA